MYDAAASAKQPTPQSAAAGVGPLSAETQPQQELYPESLENLPIQCKLTIGAADDPLETEADDMADRIMRMPEQNFIHLKSSSQDEDELPGQAKLINSTSFIQRKCNEYGQKEEGEALRRKLVSESTTPFIQTKGAAAPPISDGLDSQIQGSMGSGSSLDIDGRPSLSSFQSVVAREEIAAIDPDFVETEASVPDGMR